MDYSNHPEMIKLLNNHSKQIKELETKLFITDKFPDKVKNFVYSTFHQSNDVLWISLKRVDALSCFDKYYTLKEAIEIWNLFSPTKIYINNDGCIYTQPEWEESRGKQEFADNGFPWYLQCESTNSNVNFIFYTEFYGQKLRFNLELGSSFSHLLRMVKYSYDKYDNVKSVLSTSKINIPGCHSLLFWSLPEYPKQTTVYPVNIEEFVEYLKNNGIKVGD